MADYSNPYGSTYARVQANKDTFSRLEKAERKRREEEARQQREMEEISKNIKRREERLKAKEFGIPEQPFITTVVPTVDLPKKSRKERRKTGDWTERLKKPSRRKGSDPGQSDEIGADADLPEEAVKMLRANLEAQRKEILSLTEQLDSKTREVIALRLTLNELKEERKKRNAEQRQRSASLSEPSSPNVNGGVRFVQPQATATATTTVTTPSSPAPQEIIQKYEKEVQNLTWQLQLRDTAIDKLKESLSETKLAAQQAQALADKREEQCKILALKAKELMEAAKQKELDYELQQEELKKTKALLVSMIREKKN